MDMKALELEICELLKKIEEATDVLNAKPHNKSVFDFVYNKMSKRKAEKELEELREQLVEKRTMIIEMQQSLLDELKNKY